MRWIPAFAGMTGGGGGGTSEKDGGKNETDAGMTRHAALTRGAWRLCSAGAAVLLALASVRRACYSQRNRQ